jgi:glycosyltransferase involved in cell wall biosynthesis
MSKPRLLILTLDSLGERMAGVAIRAVELAKALNEVADVRIAATAVTGDAGVDLPVGTWHRHDHRTLRPHLRDVDMVVAQPQWPLVARELRRSGARLIYDLGIPEPLETLETQRTRPMTRRRLMSAVTCDRLVGALHDGDHFLASTDKQFDLWLGSMLSERLLGPAAYDRDPALAKRLARVPHGLPDEPPTRSAGKGLRGTFEGIGSDTEIILWNSAIWRWFDAETAIRSVAELAARRPSVKLVFMSRADGQPERVQPISAARSLAKELGVLDTHVLFHDGWVAYDERADWLLDADVALSCYRSHLETRFSFRTRYLDCFWSGLPLVVTQGDDLARTIVENDLGFAVPEADPSATADALEAVLDRGKASYAAQMRATAQSFKWSHVVRPLREIVATSPPRMRTRSPRRPGHVVRDAGYCAVRSVLNRAGIKEWPPQ